MAYIVFLKNDGILSLNFIRLPVSIIRSCVMFWNCIRYPCTSCTFLQFFFTLWSISLKKLSSIL